MIKADIKALKKIIIDKDLESINRLAEVSGINRDILGKVIKGLVQPSSNTMYKLVETLEIEPETAGKIFFSNDLHNA